MSNYVFTPEETQYYGEKVFELIANGTFKINVFKEYPFSAEGVQQAHSDLVGRTTTGKLVVKVSED
jgi:NADPH2:quinone reductase